MLERKLSIGAAASRTSAAGGVQTARRHPQPVRPRHRAPDPRRPRERRRRARRRGAQPHVRVRGHRHASTTARSSWCCARSTPRSWRSRSRVSRAKVRKKIMQQHVGAAPPRTSSRRSSCSAPCGCKTVEEAQGAIVRVIRALEEAGQIVIVEERAMSSSTERRQGARVVPRTRRRASPDLGRAAVDAARPAAARRSTARLAEATERTRRRPVDGLRRGPRRGGATPTATAAGMAEGRARRTGRHRAPSPWLPPRCLEQLCRSLAAAAADLRHRQALQLTRTWSDALATGRRRPRRGHSSAASCAVVGAPGADAAGPGPGAGSRPATWRSPASTPPTPSAPAPIWLRAGPSRSSPTRPSSRGGCVARGRATAASTPSSARPSTVSGAALLADRRRQA